MAIQMLNAILLLSAGFIAGNFFSTKTKPESSAPYSAPRVAETPRTPARGPASIPAAASAPAPDTQPSPSPKAHVDLAGYLMGFRIGDVHEACEFAQNRFLDQTVARHAHFVNSLENAKEHRSFIGDLGRRLAENEKFWVGRSDLELDDGTAKIEIVMDSHSFLPEAEEEDGASCFRAHVRLNLANGHDFSTVLDACGDSLVTKNQNYYINWETFGEPAIGRKLSVVQIPLPQSNGVELEFMRAEGQDWGVSQGFRWESVPLETGLALIDGGAQTMAQNRAASEP